MSILRAVILSGNQLTGETQVVDMASHALEKIPILRASTVSLPTAPQRVSLWSGSTNDSVDGRLMDRVPAS